MSTHYQLEQAQKLFLEGKIEEAKVYSEKWIKSSPQSAEAHYFLGWLKANNKDMSGALESFLKAITLDPHVAIYHNNISNVYVALGHLKEAIQHLHEALRINPQLAESYNNLGRLLYIQGLTSEAVPYFEKALRINPQYWEAHYNLAHSFAKQNQMTRAATHYREVIRILPEHPTAHFNLGLIAVEEQDYPTAIQHLTKSLDTSQNLEALRQLGSAYLNLGKLEEAESIFEKALLLNPNSADIHHNLAILYLRNNQKLKALDHFKNALALNPKDDTAKHMVTSLSGDQSSVEAPSNYITDLFNQYADYYDRHVKEKLQYQVPGLLRNAVGRCISATGSHAGRVLDIGCGTGLCGIYFRDLAIDLIGIDLSPKMIEKARELGAYDTLVITEMHDYLSQSLEAFDLIIAGDVLVYTGDLEKIFTLIARHLKPNGRFVFTHEWLEQGNYFLKPTGRYAHSSSYIRALAEKEALKIELEERITPREHEGDPVPGQLYVLINQKN